MAIAVETQAQPQCMSSPYTDCLPTLRETLASSFHCGVHIGAPFAPLSISLTTDAAAASWWLGLAFREGQHVSAVPDELAHRGPLAGVAVQQLQAHFLEQPELAQQGRCPSRVLPRQRRLAHQLRHHLNARRAEIGAVSARICEYRLQYRICEYRTKGTYTDTRSLQKVLGKTFFGWFAILASADASSSITDSAFGGFSFRGIFLLPTSSVQRTDRGSFELLGRISAPRWNSIS